MYIKPYSINHLSFVARILTFHFRQLFKGMMPIDVHLIVIKVSSNEG